jgi:hypothetical protein
MYYNHNWQLLEEHIDDDFDDLEGFDPNRHMQYIWGMRYIDDIVLRRQDSNLDDTLDKTWYHCTDTLFSTVVILDHTAKLVERVSYDVMTPTAGQFTRPDGTVLRRPARARRARTDGPRPGAAGGRPPRRHDPDPGRLSRLRRRDEGLRPPARHRRGAGVRGEGVRHPRVARAARRPAPGRGAAGAVRGGAGPMPPPARPEGARGDPHAARPVRSGAGGARRRGPLLRSGWGVRRAAAGDGPGGPCPEARGDRPR